MTTSTWSTPREFPFIDPISRLGVKLMIVGPEPDWFDGTIGVKHGDCDRWADVSADLDAFYCPSCKWNGRISGAWAVDMALAVYAEHETQDRGSYGPS